MKLLQTLKRLFSRKKPEVKQLLREGQRIRLWEPLGARIAIIPTDGTFYYKLDSYITITEYSTLVFASNDKEKIYFRVRNPFIEKSGEAPDDALIYFTIERFESKLIYRKLKAL